jgi:hypothetical protein
LQNYFAVFGVLMKIRKLVFVVWCGVVMCWYRAEYAWYAGMLGIRYGMPGMLVCQVCQVFNMRMVWYE